MKDLNIQEPKINFYTTVRKSFHFFSLDKLKRIIRKEAKNKNFKELNIVIVGGRKIRRINKEFLNRDKKTDVISFNLGEVCEIYICSEFVKDKKELLKLIFHGFAHIMGYDHKKEKEGKIMKEYEEKLLRDYFEKR